VKKFDRAVDVSSLATLISYVCEIDGLVTPATSWHAGHAIDLKLDPATAT